VTDSSAWLDCVSELLGSLDDTLAAVGLLVAVVEPEAQGANN